MPHVNPVQTTNSESPMRMILILNVKIYLIKKGSDRLRTESITATQKSRAAQKVLGEFLDR